MHWLKKKINTLKNLDWRWAYRYYKKRLFMNLYYRFDQIIDKQFIEVPVDGLKIKMSFVHPYHHFFARRLRRPPKSGYHETNLLTMWKKQCEKTPGVILDCGGYTGIFGLVAAMSNPHTHTYIFEPDPVNFESIQKNIMLNNLKNVTAIKGVISDTVGMVSFKQHEGGEAGNIASDEQGNFTVPSVTIDHWVNEQRQMPTLIKLDVEGAEYRALQGSTELLESSRDLNILFELHQDDFLKNFGDSTEQIWSLLSKYGYMGIWLDANIYNTHYWIYRQNTSVS